MSGRHPPALAGRWAPSCNPTTEWQQEGLLLGHRTPPAEPRVGLGGSRGCGQAGTQGRGLERGCGSRCPCPAHPGTAVGGWCSARGVPHPPPCHVPQPRQVSPPDRCCHLLPWPRLLIPAHRRRAQGTWSSLEEGAGLCRRGAGRPGWAEQQEGKGHLAPGTWEGWHRSSGQAVVQAAMHCWSLTAIRGSHTSLCMATYGLGVMSFGRATALAPFALVFPLPLPALMPTTTSAPSSAMQQ